MIDPLTVAHHHEVPPGNYNVTVELGSPDRPASTGVTVEARRRMLAETGTAAGQLVRRRFAVNLRDPKGQPVWEGSPPSTGLDLVFTGAAPHGRVISVEPITDGRPTLLLGGDSTVCDQHNHPFTGWGQMIPPYLRPEIVVANYADSGRGSRTFQEDPRLFQAVLAATRPGDPVLLQFGHNDKTTTAADYRADLTTMITAVRERGGRPILISPPVRREFDEQGRLTSYARHVNSVGVDLPGQLRQIGAAEKVPLLDLTAASAELVTGLGPAASTSIYLTAECDDDTHFSEYGADTVARLVVELFRSSFDDAAAFLASPAG
ncbi:rhamnogalacturonan acetylesterase [Actinoplanes couchii]|uniref:Rhamnogalacturonan acetylesterase n=1 Tax=Actinoplanes couchii TaxID=403638 RepID=A0ABQ3XHV8_9ACTN|nr:rhamnogalacturonan acetylesterase [Actinoplanes couchii]MDR6317686.1 lysophospholipase L1-like esterase [Actinoplanes couchii]GID58071.1 rhamnogalacturonan acetylesterase [Actinoplanes couchii]